MNDLNNNFMAYDSNIKPRRGDVVLMDMKPNKTNPLVKEEPTNVFNYATSKTNNMHINKEELAKARLKHIIETQGSKGFKAITENELYSDMKF